MTQWTYLLLMKCELHAEMRVFQVVNNQQTPVLAFASRRSENLVTMNFIIGAEKPRAQRIEALLLRLQSILRVDVFPITDAASSAPVQEQQNGDY